MEPAIESNPQGGVVSEVKTDGIRLSRRASDLRLWWASLDVTASALRGFEAYLSAEELTRAAGYHRRVDRRRFVAARGSLRGLLASELGCAPSEVSIVTGERGKPRFVGSELRFSASRSANIALYAVSWTSEVGVDVEAIRLNADLDGVAARYFSPGEQRSLASLPPTERPLACYQYWTRKEAYLKGVGIGLTSPLRDIDLSVPPGPAEEMSRWCVRQVAILPGFAAAVAVQGLRAISPGDPAPRRRGGPTGSEAQDSVMSSLVPVGGSPRARRAESGSA